MSNGGRLCDRAAGGAGGAAAALCPCDSIPLVAASCKLSLQAGSALMRLRLLSWTPPAPISTEWQCATVHSPTCISTMKELEQVSRLSPVPMRDSTRSQGVSEAKAAGTKAPTCAGERRCGASACC